MKGRRALVDGRNLLIYGFSCALTNLRVFNLFYKLNRVTLLAGSRIWDGTPSGKVMESFWSHCELSCCGNCCFKSWIVARQSKLQLAQYLTFSWVINHTNFTSLSLGDLVHLRSRIPIIHLFFSPFASLPDLSKATERWRNCKHTFFSFSFCTNSRFDSKEFQLKMRHVIEKSLDMQELERIALFYHEKCFAYAKYLENLQLL